MRMINKLDKGIALFLVALVLSMPITFAAAINPELIAGKQGINGILGTSDQLQIKTAVQTAAASSSSSTSSSSSSSSTSSSLPSSSTAITASNVLVTIFGSTQPFTECTQTGTGEYFCTYQSQDLEKTPGSYQGGLKLTNAEQQTVAQYPFTITIDGLAPVIQTAVIPIFFTNEINLRYKVLEKSCPTCTACAGFSRMNLKISGNVIYTKDLASVAGCLLDETTSIAAASLSSIEEGKQQACLEFVDKLGQAAESCQQVTVDVSSPTLASENMQLLDNAQTPITHVRNAPMQAALVANISDIGSGIDTNTVKADFSALNVNMGQSYANSQGQCSTLNEGKFLCSWQFMIDLPFAETDESIKTVPVKISLSDLAGNNYNFSKNFDIRQDKTSPIAKEIITTHPGYLNKDNNTLIVEIDESPSDSGLDKKEVYLDLASFGLGIKQADRCQSEGAAWNCYFESFSIPAGINSGRTGYMKISRLEDDVGNGYDTGQSIIQRTAQYDGEAPQILNITLKPLGRDIKVIQTDDVVQVTAFIKETVSGLDKTKTLIDFSSLSEGAPLTEANDCVESAENMYECTWEFTGTLTPGSVRVSIIAEDNAGNKKDSRLYNVYGTASIVETQEFIADFFSEETRVAGIPKLNPNFLYLSPSGTLVKLDVALQRKQGASYVHEFVVKDCIAALQTPGASLSPGNGTAALEAPVTNQFYYPNNPRENKYLLVNLPPIFRNAQLNTSQMNASLIENWHVDILCQGEVTQGRTPYSSIYTPNEVVNITARVDFIGGLYTEPSLATVDKIQRGQKFIEGIDKYVLSWMKIWVEWGTKICGPMNTIRATINNIATITDSIDVILGKTPANGLSGGLRRQFSSISDSLQKLWMGGPNGKGCEPSSDPLGCPSPYGFPSVGLLCDTVLCENCGEQWGKITGAIFKDKGLSSGLSILLGKLYSGPESIKERKNPASATPAAAPAAALETTAAQEPEPDTRTGAQREEEALRLGGERQTGLEGEGVQAVLSPYDNLVVAIICWPPCMTGIYGQLNVYKQIHMHYNTCLNIAAIKGEDLNQCDTFLASQICQQIVGGFFWNWFYKLMLAFISKAVVGTLEKLVAAAFKCPPDAQLTAETSGPCHAWRSVQATTIAVLTVVDTVQIWKGQIDDFKTWFGGNTTQTQETLNNQTEQGYEERIQGQLGGDPYAG